MCGIAGILNFNKRAVALDELRAMTGRMVRRGPDDEGFYCRDGMGIGMRRLSIIDVGGGHQPIGNEDGSVMVVLNGEIYNYVELRTALKARGHVFKTDSDTEVIVHLYEEKGREAVADLNGMFAFALYDVRREALWIVRDRLGIKPLYYAEADERLVFASDINAIRAVVSTELSAETFLRYLALGYAPGERTFYSEIRKLLPAHELWIEAGATSRRRYWDVPAIGTWRGTAARAKEQLEFLLADSVKLQLRSDVPLGVFLSGGLDSSSIVALAAHGVTESLRTLTIEFEGKDSADARHARSVAARYRTNHREIAMGPADAFAALTEVLPWLDEPICDSAIIPSYLLSKRAREEGLKVLLTGAGGDELFGGYGRHWPPRFGSPSWVAESLPGALRRMVGAAWSIGNPARGARATDPILAWAATISGVNLHACRSLLRGTEAHLQVVNGIHEEFDELLAAQRRDGYAYGRMGTDLRKYLVNDVLSLNDKTTMIASVEGRVPLLDHRLVEFAFSLPPELNLLGGRPKGLLRETMIPHLPAELLNRRKEGFNGPLSSWMENDASFNIAKELTETPVPLVAQYIDLAALQHVLRHRETRRGAACTLFALYMFNRWCRSRRW